MKKIYLILLAVLGMTATSCLMEEKELFDKTAAERLDAYLTEYNTLLESSENGWLLEYYAEEEQSYGGYAYILQFAEGEVTAYFQLADKLDETRTSYYKLTTDDGPVLTFDTYNEYIHFFATPDIENYQALQGDYEFRILALSEDASEITIQGKRTGNYMKLRKFEQDPVQYLTKSADVEAAMAAPAYSVTVDGTTYPASISNNVLTFSYSVAEGEASTPVEVSISFCYTPDGVSFYETAEVNGASYDVMAYDATNTRLSTEDGKFAINPVFPPVNELFVGGDWLLDLAGCSQATAAQFMKGFNAVGAKGYPFNFAFMGDDYYGSWGFNVNFAGYGGVLNFDYELVGEDKITMQFNLTAGGNGGTFYNWGLSQSIVPLGLAAPKTFTITADDNKNPMVFVLTDDADPNNVIQFVY